MEKCPIKRKSINLAPWLASLSSCPKHSSVQPSRHLVPIMSARRGIRLEGRPLRLLPWWMERYLYAPSARTASHMEQNTSPPPSNNKSSSTTIPPTHPPYSPHLITKLHTTPDPGSPVPWYSLLHMHVQLASPPARVSICDGSGLAEAAREHRIQSSPAHTSRALEHDPVVQCLAGLWRRTPGIDNGQPQTACQQRIGGRR